MNESNYPPGVTGGEYQIVGSDDPEIGIAKVTALDKANLGQFRNAFVTTSGHDFRTLQEYADKIQFLTTGYEKSIAEQNEMVINSLMAFDPATDVIIPSTGVLTAILFGLVVKDILRNMGTNKFILGVYSRRNYEFYEVELWP